MTKKKAEAACRGEYTYTVTRETGSRGGRSFRVDVTRNIDGLKVSSVTATRESDAIDLAANDVYRIYQKIAIERANYRCQNCTRIGAIETDHKVPRSKGRDDHWENLMALCHRCHSIKHGAGKR